MKKIKFAFLFAFLFGVILVIPQTVLAIEDIVPPTGTVSVAVPVISNTNNIQTITVTYDESMDTNFTPVISFGENGNFTANNDGSWSEGNTVWTESFTHSILVDTSEAVTVSTTGTAKDLAGNPENLSTSGENNPFDINYLEPDEVFIDDSFTEDSHGDYVWGATAFDNINQGMSAVATGGTVNVLAGSYDNFTVSKSLIIAGAGSDVVTIDADGEDYGIEVQANAVQISGFTIINTSGDVPSAGIYLNGVSGCNIHDNELYSNRYGIWLYGANNNTISRNDVSDNNQIGIFLAGSSSNTIDSNWASDTGIGIRVQASSNSNTITNNNIYSNIRGINILASSGNTFSQNTITGNDTGALIQNTSVGNNLSQNWWESDTGPLEATYNTEGMGQTITVNDPENSLYNYFRPWCMNAECSDLSVVEVTPETISLLFDDGGSIAPSDMDENVSAVTTLNVNEETVINVENDAEVTIATITLPAGTEITNTNGDPFDATTMEAVEVSLDEISGLGGNALGAVEWGLPALGLSFNPAIEISLYVGTDLNGRTLQVRRQPAGEDSWTSEGLEETTCEVVDGFCTFNATRASTYASYKKPSSGGGNTAQSRYENLVAMGNTEKAEEVATQFPNAVDTSQASANTVTKFVFTKNLKLGMTDSDVKELQKYLNAHGFPVATTGAGSTGFETNTFGPKTKAALIAFQKANNITPSVGYCGPITRGVLNK